MPAVTELFQRLIDGLKEETVHYDRLVGLGEEQKEILVAGDLPRLSDNVRRSEKELFSLGPLTKSRAEVLGQIGTSLGLKDASLAAVSEKAPEQVKTNFDDTVSGVAVAARRLDEVNKVNEKLLENAVGYVNFTLNALSGPGNMKTTFSPEAAKPMGQSAPAASMLNRIV